MIGLLAWLLSGTGYTALWLLTSRHYYGKWRYSSQILREEGKSRDAWSDEANAAGALLLAGLFWPVTVLCVAAGFVIERVVMSNRPLTPKEQAEVQNRDLRIQHGLQAREARRRERHAEPGRYICDPRQQFEDALHEVRHTAAASWSARRPADIGDREAAAEQKLRELSGLSQPGNVHGRVLE